ncbi:hypothetical protein cyc_06415 [Cyclospora cayetanensis]|nr:hypothetical protein cyc_06415 [Cyclospora cayetanensis]
MERPQARSSGAVRRHLCKEILPQEAIPETRSDQASPYPFVVKSLQETTKSIQGIAGTVSFFRLLQLCCNLAQLGRCPPLLAASVLQQLLLPPRCLHPSSVAFGLQLSALLLEQTMLRVQCNKSSSGPNAVQPDQLTPHDPSRPPKGLQAQTGRRRYVSSPTAVSGSLSSTVILSRSSYPGFQVDGHIPHSTLPGMSEVATLQRLSLLVATQLLELLTQKDDLPTRLPLKTCVMTAEACIRLLSQKPDADKFVQLPTAFTTATTLSPGACLLDGGKTAESTLFRTDPNVLGLPECSTPSADNTVHPAKAKLTEYTLRDTHLPIPVPSGMPPRAICDLRVASGLSAVALWHRIQKSLAPAVAMLLLAEASARKERGAVVLRKEQEAYGRADELLAAAMSAALKCGLTRLVAKRLLLRLLCRLQQHHSNVYQLPALGPSKNRDVVTDTQFMCVLDSNADVSLRGVTASVLTPVILASICRSLAVAGVTIGTSEITFLFKAIGASLHVHAMRQSISGFGSAGRVRKSSDKRCCTFPADFDVVGGQKIPRKADVCTSTDPAPHNLPCASASLSHIEASYGNWCTVLWAGAKIIKGASSNLLAEDPFFLKRQSLILCQLLVTLVGGLSTAEPADAAQIAEALRLLLLLDLRLDSHQPCLTACIQQSRPLLLRQQLFRAEELLSTLHALVQYFMENHERCGALELLGILRLFVQFDLLHYIDVKMYKTGEKFHVQQDGNCRALATSGQCKEKLLVSATEFLNCVIKRLLSLNGTQQFNVDCTASLESPLQLGHGAFVHAADQPLGMFAQSLLRSVAVKYPEELRRMSKVHQGSVLRYRCRGHSHSEWCKFR